MGFAAPEGAPAETGAEVRLPESGPAWRAGYSATAPGRIGPDKPPVSCHEPWFGCHEPIKAAARQRQGAQGRRSVAAAAAADRADGGGQYCQVPRHVRRQGRGGAARGHAAAAGRRSLLRSRRVCVSASACLLCVSALRGCLGREIKPHSVLRPLRTPGRPRAGAVARVPFGRCHIHALRATWTSASRFGSVRGERQARVPPALLRVCACVRVCGLMLSSVYFVDCACGCARYIVFLYVCFMCVY